MEPFGAIATQDSSAIVAEQSDDPTVLVVFGGILEMPGIPPLEFFNITEGIQARRIFVRDPHRAFYAHGLDSSGGGIHAVVHALSPLLENHNRLVFVGNSAGASAALYAGAHLKAHDIRAFAPVSFLDRPRRLIHRDFRWRKNVARARRGKILDLRSALATQPPHKATIYYGRHCRLDAVHARHLRGVDNLELCPVPGSDHQIVRALRDNGHLRSILEKACMGQKDR